RHIHDERAQEGITEPRGRHQIRYREWRLPPRGGVADLALLSSDAVVLSSVRSSAYRAQMNSWRLYCHAAGLATISHGVRVLRVFRRRAAIALSLQRRQRGIQR